MKIYREPRVYCVARPQLDWSGITQFFQDEYGSSVKEAWVRGSNDQDSESLCELMGRLCYGSFGAKQGRMGATTYLQHILAEGHGSILEHANWSFIVTRASRGFTHQMVRHRAGFGYSQESTHFIKYEDAAVCLPDMPQEYLDQAQHSLSAALQAYIDIWDKLEGKKKSKCAAARGLLPTALEAKLGFTANARALRHFIELRGAEANVPEIRLVAAKVLKAIGPNVLFADFQVTIAADGFPVLTSKWRKV